MDFPYPRPAVLAGAVLDLCLPELCGGCGRFASRWCSSCERAVGALLTAGAHPVQPSPAPAGMPSTWSVAAYDGPVRRALVAYKDEGRRDLDAVLARLLGPAVVTAARAARAGEVGEAGSVGGLGDSRRSRRAERMLLVPVPSSAAAVRRRGDRPLVTLTRRVVRMAGQPDGRDAGWGSVERPHLSDSLVVTRRVADQAGLSHTERAGNLSGAFVVPPPRRPEVEGAICVLVDDVVTTGATLAEASRALLLAGATRVHAATVAATARRR